jgi:uncharacterized protein with von Willebrand factor type A (vWA) domain
LFFSRNICTVSRREQKVADVNLYEEMSNIVKQLAKEPEYETHMMQISHFDYFHLHAIHTSGDIKEIRRRENIKFEVITAV